MTLRVMNGKPGIRQESGGQGRTNGNLRRHFFPFSSFCLFSPFLLVCYFIIQEVILSFGKSPAGVPSSGKKCPRYLDEDEEVEELDNDKVIK